MWYAGGGDHQSLFIPFFSFSPQPQVNNHLYLFIKLANAGNFAKYVKEKGVLTEKEAGYFFSQILLGLDYMHSKSIAHRDMKLVRESSLGAILGAILNSFLCRTTSSSCASPAAS